MSEVVSVLAVPPPLFFAFQRFDKSRDCDQNRDTLLTNHIDQAGRLEGIDKDYRPRQERRYEYSQHLAEDVAQRKEVQKSQRMKDSLIAEVFLNLTPNRLDVGKDVAVRNHDAARLRGCPRSVNNLQRVLTRERRRGVRRRVTVRNEFRKRFQNDGTRRRLDVRNPPAAKD